jgi:hypothetical protein
MSSKAATSFQSHTLPDGTVFEAGIVAGVVVFRLPHGTRGRLSRMPAPLPTYEGRAFRQYPQTSQKLARHRHAFFKAYFRTLRLGAGKAAAERCASIASAKYFGRAITTRRIRSWAVIIESHGGEDAPLSAYLDGKSCAHPRARKERKS